MVNSVFAAAFNLCWITVLYCRALTEKEKIDSGGFVAVPQEEREWLAERCLLVEKLWNKSKIPCPFLALRHLLLLRQMRDPISGVLSRGCDWASIGAQITPGANIAFLSTAIKSSLDDDTAEAVGLQSHQTGSLSDSFVHSWEVGVMRIFWLSLLRLTIGNIVLFHFLLFHHCL